MSVSMLYHTNQIEDVQVNREEFHPDKVVFHVLFTPRKTICPCCGDNKPFSKGSKNRKLRLPPIGLKMAFLMVTIHRLQCVNCLHTWWPPIPFAKSKSVTHSLLRDL